MPRLYLYFKHYDLTDGARSHTLMSLVTRALNERSIM